MRQSLSSVLPESESTAGGRPGHRRPRTRPPMVERIAGWSTRHRKIAVFGWLAMVLAIVALGQLMGSRNLPQPAFSPA